MQLNHDKSGILIINEKRSTASKFENQTKRISGIPIVGSYKYLGVTINRQLYPTVHIDIIQSKLDKFKKMMLIMRL